MAGTSTQFWSVMDGRAFFADDDNPARAVTNLVSLNGAQQQMLIEALNLWADVSGFTPVEAVDDDDLADDSTSTNIFGNWVNELPNTWNRVAIGTIGSGAIGSNRSNDNNYHEIYISPLNIGSTTFEIGSQAFDTLLHELGHSIVDFNQDGGGHLVGSSPEWTVMTPTSNRLVQTPMMLDIDRAAALHGAATTTRLGDDVYGFNVRLSGDYRSAFDFAVNDDPLVTIFDNGGHDRLDASGFTDASGARAVHIDLDPAASSWYQNNGQAFAIIYRTTWIEDAAGGGANDTLLGNFLDNVLHGGGGGDWLDGRFGSDTASYAFATAGVTADLQLAGNNTGEAVGDVYTSIENLAGSSFDDTLRGDAGLNAIRGGVGNDVLEGRGGFDSLHGDDGNDTFISGGPGSGDYMNGGEGADTVSYETATQYALVDLALPNGNNGAAVEDSYWSVENVTGSNFEDNLRGDEGANQLAGRDGDDTIFGRGGNDTIFGERDNDTLLGDAGHDTIYGGHGNDVIAGGEGSDYLEGGVGDDTYFVDTNADMVREGRNDGTDRVIASTSFSLAPVRADVEFLEAIVGTDPINLTGSNSDNTLIGNDGDNVLNGRGGIDTLTGGLGNDTYVVDTLTDSIVEANGAGVDLVESSTSFSLVGTFVENLTLTGSLSIDGTGNDGNNVIRGNGRTNGLFGGIGDDQIDGGGGRDFLDGGANADILRGGAGGDTIYGGADLDLAMGEFGDDTIDGGEGEDYLTGGYSRGFFNRDAAFLRDGNDTVYGRAGNDTIYVSGGTDTVQGNEGIDILSFAWFNSAVTASLSETRASFVELVREAGDGPGGSTSGTLFDIVVNYTGFENIEGGLGNDRLTGDAATNALTGGSGDDTLDGGAGADILVGGRGNDTYVVDHAADVVREAAGEGEDRVNALVDYRLAAGEEIESVHVMTSTGLAVTGNERADRLFGNTGADRLTGGVGNDSLAGGGGNDFFGFGNAWGRDTVTDFDLTGDRLDMRNMAGLTDFGQLTLEDSPDGLRVSFELLDSITLRGITAAQLTASSFLFAAAGATFDGTAAWGGTIVGTDAVDTVSYAGATYAIYVDLMRDGGYAEGLNGAAQSTAIVSLENIVGAPNNLNYLHGNDANNVLTGGDSFDWLTGRGGNNRLDGRGGSDLADYYETALPVTIDLAGGFAVHATGIDTLIGIEQARGTNANDVFIGDGRDNYFLAMNGADTVTGGGGRDWLDGSGDNDIIDGGVGEDRLVGSSGNDTLAGGAEADAFVFGVGDLGADYILDFSAAEGDRIDFSESATVESLGDLVMTAGSTGVLISFASGSVELTGIGEVSASWFVF